MVTNAIHEKCRIVNQVSGPLLQTNTLHDACELELQFVVYFWAEVVKPSHLIMKTPFWRTKTKFVAEQRRK